MTVINIIENSPDSPTTVLDSILSAGSKIEQLPFAHLDAMYHQILASVANLKLGKVLLILHCIMYIPSLTATTELDAIFGYEAGEVDIILRRMRSLLRIPDTGSSNEYIRFLHPSMPEFLLDPFRAKHLYISPADAKASIAISLINRNQGKPFSFTR